MSNHKNKKIESNYLDDSSQNALPKQQSSSSTNINIKSFECEDITTVAKALSSPVRLQILQLLARRDANIGQLTAELGLSQSNTTQQIAQLEAAGLVSCRREAGSKGQQKICRLWPTMYC